MEQKPADSTKASQLRAMIRRRRVADVMFACLGLLLVVASLALLILLFGQLARDGVGRLASTHEVNEAGFSPGRRDLLGQLERHNSGYRLVRDAITITNAAKLDAASLKDLEGQAVIVQAPLPAPGVSRVEAAGIAAADSPEPAFSRSEIHGRLVRQQGTWQVKPWSLPLDESAVEADLQSLVGQRVVVDPGRSAQLPLEPRSIERVYSQSFFGAMPSREAERAGIQSALIGSVLVVTVTMFLALPLGVAAGVYLEEYGRRNWFTALIEINIANLAGVPSIIWGLMALGLFVYQFGFGRSILTAGMTLGLLVLPIVIMATRESIRAIPGSIREASYACGSTKWQTVRFHLVPYSLSGILTGAIIGLSRAIGETAPLITIGALTYIAFLPDFSLSQPLAWLSSEFTVLPIQMFNWISRPDQAFHNNAAAAGVVLLALTLSMNAVAIVLRYRLRKSVKW